LLSINQGKRGLGDHNERTAMASEFFCTLNGKPAGPFSADELKGLAAVGKLSPSDFIRKGKEGEWVSASKFKRLFEEKQSAPLPPDRLSKAILAGVIVVSLGGLVGLLLDGHGHKSGTQTNQQRAIANPEMRGKGSLAEVNGKQPGTKPALVNTNNVRKETTVQKKAGKGVGKDEDESPLPSKRQRSRLPMNRVN
jgi:hypothetical protein